MTILPCDWMETVIQLEQVGILRALLFLQEGKKMYSDFDEVMSANTWTKARRVLLDLGWVEIEEGKNRAKVHSLTEKGRAAEGCLDNMVSET